MKQVKKSVFNMYSSMLASTLKNISRKLGPKVNALHHIGHFIAKSPEVSSSIGLEVSIYTEEHYWARNGRNVIFPESISVIENLMRAKYEIDDTEGFTLPFLSFAVAMPAGVTSNGYRVPGFLASLSPTEHAEEKLHPFIESINLDRSMYQAVNRVAGRVLVVQYKNPTDGSHGKMGVEEKDLPRLLRCRTVAEYSAEMREYTGLLASNTVSTEEDMAIQFYALKLVAAIGVYNMATDGKRLIDGFPGASIPKLMGHDGSSGLRLSTLQNVAQATKGSPESHYRTWHFRHLRAPCYYRGQYADVPQGSRYVFVSDAVVGQTIDPSTVH
jgi:hypothetical protein